MRNHNCISDIRLYKNLLDLECYYVGTNKEFSLLMQDVAKCCHHDISALSFEIVQSVIFEDSSIEEKEHGVIDVLSDTIKSARDLLNHKDSIEPLESERCFRH